MFVRKSICCVVHAKTLGKTLNTYQLAQVEQDRKLENDID